MSLKGRRMQHVEQDEEFIKIKNKQEGLNLKLED